MIYEYRVERLPDNENNKESLLNQRAEQTWELVTVVYVPGYSEAYFRRSK
jgi:hypothetical protein